MNIIEARNAIEAILAAIPDDELPEFDKVEVSNDETIVWWGGSGHILGTAKTGGGERNPIQYRTGGSWNAIQAEMTYRADRRYLDNGDKADGIRLAKKSVSA